MESKPTKEELESWAHEVKTLSLNGDHQCVSLTRLRRLIKRAKEADRLEEELSNARAHDPYSDPDDVGM